MDLQKTLTLLWERIRVQGILARQFSTANYLFSVVTEAVKISRLYFLKNDRVKQNDLINYVIIEKKNISDQ